MEQVRKVRRTGLRALAVAGLLGVSCVGCVDPGTADDLTMTLSFAFPNPGHEARLEFGEVDIERYRLGDMRENRQDDPVLIFRVPSGGRTDADSADLPYCFEEPVMLVDVAGQVDPAVLVAGGGCTNSGPGAWADPQLLE